MFILQTEKYVLKKVVKAIFFNCEFEAASEAALIYSWMDRVQRCESTELKVGLCVNSKLGLAKLGKLTKFCKFLAGSFSAVSKRNFAIKYAFDSIFQALQDLHPFAPLQSQNFRKKSV